MIRAGAPSWLTRWEYAHRGLHSPCLPENSLGAARAAIERGMGIECDIQRSRDDWPMVFHDWELSRLTEGQGETEHFTREELCQLRYRGSNERIVSLDQLLELVGGRVPLLIEIKSKPGYDVAWSCAVVARCLADYRGAFAVMSFDPRVARWLRRHAPHIGAGLVMREDEHGYTQKAWQRRLAFWIAQPQFLAYHIAALPNRWVEGLRRRGLPILTWTVNSPETRARALKYADALISEGAGLDSSGDAHGR